MTVKKQKDIFYSQPSVLTEQPVLSFYTSLHSETGDVLGDLMAVWSIYMNSRGVQPLFFVFTVWLLCSLSQVYCGTNLELSAVQLRLKRAGKWNAMLDGLL